MSDARQLTLGLGKGHRNHGLFSDHYLEEILRREPVWEKTQARAAGLLAFLRALYAQEQAQLPAYSEAQLEERWIKPILGQLGHVWEPQAAVPGLDRGIKKPDYVFFADDDARRAAVADQRTDEYARHALAIGEVKAWPVNLSKKTAGAPTFDNNNPMFQIDYYLKSTGVHWGIVANGRVWRLVQRDTSYKLDVFFEVDLLDALTAADERQALAVVNYFAVLFGQDAFRPGPTGARRLDDVLRGSRTYAVALESDLRDNAYKALEQLIIGFFAPTANGLDANDPADRDAVYRHSLLLLYRLLFLFFGESRGLLPMRNPAYVERSLTELAKVAARQVDNHTVDSQPTMTRRHWGHLAELFAVINGDDSDLNAILGVPRYNGGLFDPQRHAFLEQKFVGDRHLLRALDYLARRRKTDDKGSFAGYEPVDYRTLGVRQLGSIYEGLLEYKVSVAAEALVTVRRGGKETWLPARERGKAKTIETKAPGELYLATDKGERKATGSYYTPDAIVKYIVEQTLGPLVAEARRRAEEAHAGDAPGAKTHGPEGQRAAAARRFEAEILALNILDPAMGSGHFLVDATDYLARALATAEWTTAGGKTTADGRPPTADGTTAAATPNPYSLSPNPYPSEESDLTYWRRRVVEACIYGVDKNELAVELAKLSLWLVTVAEAKPLSFLDHHLRHGDSLIGAWLKDLDRPPGAIRGRSSAAGGQPSEAAPLFDESAFTANAGQAVSEAATIETMLTEDLAAVHAKEQVYQTIRDTHLGRWRRLADLWVSAWFGNEMSAAEYRDLALRLQGQPEATMSAEQAARYLNHPAATDNDYFHWELEFPEVFFDRYGRPKGERAGFDAVIGNPPYDELSEVALGRQIIEKDFFLSVPHFTSAVTYRVNLSRLFIAHAVFLTKRSGLHGFIVPMSFLGDRFTYELRRDLLNQVTFIKVDAFPQKDDPYNRVFFEAKLPTCLYILRNHFTDGAFAVRTHPGKDIMESSPSYKTTASEIVRVDPENATIPVISHHEWSLYSRLAADSGLTTIGKIANPMSGEIVFNQQFRPYLSTDPKHTLVLRGGHIQRYELINDPKQGEPVYIDKDLWLSNTGDGLAANAHKKPRVVYQESAALDNWRRIIATYLPAGLICGHKICYFSDIACEDLAFLAVFNSSVVEWRFQLVSTTNSLSAYQIRPIPFPRFAFNTPEAERLHLTEEAQAIFSRSPFTSVIEGELLTLMNSMINAVPKKTAVVHDFLAYLAEQMLAMHKERQSLTADFWIDLEGVTAPAAFRKLRDKGKQEAGLAADPALAAYVRAGSHSTRALDESLAWDEAAFKAFVRALAGPVDGLSGLVKVYGRYAPRYRELVERIAHTDRLIDQIVYKLYGLTDEEIAIVEGRA